MKYLSNMMIRANLADTAAANIRVMGFLQYANKKGQQSNALLALNEQARKIGGKKGFSRKEICNMITDRIEANPELKLEADKFVSGLKKSYPQTWQDRIYLARGDKFHKIVAGFHKMMREV